MKLIPELKFIIIGITGNSIYKLFNDEAFLKLKFIEDLKFDEIKFNELEELLSDLFPIESNDIRKFITVNDFHEYMLERVVVESMSMKDLRKVIVEITTDSIQKVLPDDIFLAQKFIEDLKFNETDFVELELYLDEYFSVEEGISKKFITVNDCYEYIQEHNK